MNYKMFRIRMFGLTFMLLITDEPKEKTIKEWLFNLGTCGAVSKIRGLFHWGIVESNEYIQNFISGMNKEDKQHIKTLKTIKEEN